MLNPTNVTIKNKIVITIITIVILFLTFVKWPNQTSQCIKTNNSEIVEKINKDLFLLSIKGSSRATAYANLSKIIFIDDICLIAWLGVDEAKFKPIVAIYDLKEKKITNKYTFDESFDNHGVPSLVVDNNNKIHLFYYPHGAQPIKYKTGKLIGNNKIVWQCEEDIGQSNLTYPNPIFHKNNGLFLFARKTPNIPGPNPLATYSFFKMDEDKSRINDLLISETSGYAAFSSRVLMSENKIQILSRFHENSDNSYYGKTQTISYIESLDNMESWQKDNENTINYNDRGIWSWKNFKLDNLITANKSSVIDKGGLEKENVLDVIGIYNDSVNDVNTFYLKEKLYNSKLIKAVRNNENGKWTNNSINDLIFPKLDNQRFVHPTGNLVTDSGVIMFSGVLQDESIKRDAKIITDWGHKSNSVVLFTKEKEKYKILIEFKSRSKCVWFPYVKLKGNDLLLIFTKGAESNTANGDALYETEVFLFHSKLNELLKKEYKKVLI